MNKKRLIFVIVLSIFILGMVLGPVEAKTKHYKKEKLRAKKTAVLYGDKIKHVKHFKINSFNKHTHIHNTKLYKYHNMFIRHGYIVSSYTYKTKTTPHHEYWYEGCYYYK